MKKKIISVLTAFCLMFMLFELPVSASPAASDDVQINETNFPDEQFREFIKQEVDKNKDGSLSDAERGIYSMFPSDHGFKKIKDFKGLEFFDKLTAFGYDYSEEPVAIDFSNNPSLQYINAFDGNVTSVDVSGCKDLIQLLVESNYLSSLDVSQNTELELLTCHGNNLTSLDVTNNTKLKEFSCSDTKLSAIDVTKNTALEKLYIQDTPISSVDLSNNTNLLVLDINDCEFETIDLSKNTKLEKIYFAENKLTSIVFPNQTLEVWSGGGNSYDISTDCGNRTFDLATLPGSFDVSKAYDWDGGTVSGNTLTIAKDVDAVKYKYTAKASNVTYAPFKLNVKVEHEYDDGVVTKEPTVTEEGERTFTCSKCGATKTEPIPVGEITTEVNSSENAPVTEVQTPKAELIETVLTSDEKDEVVTHGIDITIILKVEDATNSVSPADKEKVETAISDLSGSTLGQYLDVSLLKKIGTNAEEKITNTKAPIKVTFEIPETLRKEGRVYSVIRVHDGETTVLEDKDNASDTVTIETDKFSTYALVYNEKATEGEITTAVNSGENAPVTEVQTPKAELIEAVLTSDEKDEVVTHGINITIILKVEDATDSVSPADKEKVETAISELSGSTLGQYLDVSLLKKIGTNAEEKITITKAPIKVSFEIPETLRKEGRVYSVIRVHDGETTVLADKDNDPQTVTIETDKFSTYALVYNEKATEPDNNYTPPTIIEEPSDSSTTSPSGETSSTDDSSSESELSSSTDDSSVSSGESSAENSGDGSAENNGNPTTGIAVSLVPLAMTLAVVTAAVNRKKK